MYNQLPLQIDREVLLRQPTEFAGDISVADCPRLRKVLCGTEGEVAVVLWVGCEEFSEPYIRARIDTQLRLPCQRCGVGVCCDINTEFQYCPVSTDAQAAHVPEGYEPLLTASMPIQLLELVEEEVLLSLPMVAKHEGGCSVDFPVEV